VDRTLIAANGPGEAIYLDDTSDVDLTCSNLHANLGGDYVGDLASLLGVDGNISADPRLCRPLDDRVSVSVDSPCLPGHHPDGVDCGRIGTGDGACAWVSVLPGVDPTASRPRWTAHPVPSQSSVTFRWQGTGIPPDHLTIVDAAGRAVDRVPMVMGLGTWDLVGPRGEPVPDGIYFGVGDEDGPAVRVTVLR
jgi:hypothetical protein